LFLRKARLFFYALPFPGAGIVLPDDPCGISCDHGIGRDVLGDHAAGCDDGMTTDRYSCHNDGITAYPAIIFNTDESGSALLVADGRMDVHITVVHSQDTYMLGEDDVIPDLYGPDHDVTYSNDGAASDEHISHAVIDGGEVFDDGPVSDLEFPEGHDVQSCSSANNRSFPSFVHKGVDKKPDPPSGPGLPCRHHHVQKEFLHPWIGSYLLQEAQFEIVLSMAR
jgi:hypothetical protein